MDPYKDHPNLSPEINHAFRKSELDGGIWFKELPIGSVVEVQTKHTLYIIERRLDGDYIQGNLKYCPEPIKCRIAGSTWGGSMLKVGWIGIDMLLEFSVGDFSITTSIIKDVRLKGEVA